jgi:hypothetical protein
VDGRLPQQSRRDLASRILNTFFLLIILLSCVYLDSEWATGLSEQVIRAPDQQDLALKVGGTSQARLSQLELQPGRLRSQGPLSNPSALLEPMAADELASWESGALLPEGLH